MSCEKEEIDGKGIGMGNFESEIVMGKVSSEGNQNLHERG